MRWYVSIAGQTQGPHDEATVLSMIQGGQVPPDAFVCPEGGSAWAPLASHAPFVGGTAGAGDPLAAQAPMPKTMAFDSAQIQAHMASFGDGGGASSGSSPGLGASPMAAQPSPAFAPGPGSQGGSPAAPAGSPAAPAAKSKAPLFIGIGCGALLLLGLCGGGGALAYSALFG